MLEIIEALPWYAWVAIVAVIGGSISSTIVRWMSHRERMEMIRHGMHPDSHENAKDVSTHSE